jgi:hypothetical protein
MPWVPDGRAGHAGGNSDRAGSCKHMQTSPELILGALIHRWVHLAGVSGGEKTYSGSGIIIKIYPALSLAIGGRDRVDAGGGHWMMCSNYRTRHQSWLSGHFLAIGLIWQGFRVG